MTILSLLLIVLGIFTNFHVEVDGDILWTPKGVRTVEHRDWIENPLESGYSPLPRTFICFVHANGDNVLDTKAIEILFDTLDTVRSLPDYEDACSSDDYARSFTGEKTCQVVGPVKFWNNTKATFTNIVTSNEDMLKALSAEFYPDGTPVSRDDLYGYPDFDSAGILQSAKGMSMFIPFAETEDAKEFESKAVEAILELAAILDQDESIPYKLEVVAERSYDDEIDAAIVADLPLVPIIFVVMSIFTALIFARRHPVQSRSLLGFTAVVSVLLAIMSGYGLAFLCGVNVSRSKLLA